MQRFYRLARFFAENVWDTMLEPLVAREDFRRRFDLDAVQREAWRSLAEEPLGRAIERHLQNDLLRGLVFTDAKIGVFTHPHDETLLQNRCFLYHLIGNKRGEWKVPVGGWALSHASWNKPRARAAPRCLTRVDLQALALRK
jgi:phytoene dehydrogenase-like protein